MRLELLVCLPFGNAVTRAIAGRAAFGSPLGVHNPSVQHFVLETEEILGCECVWRLYYRIATEKFQELYSPGTASSTRKFQWEQTLVKVDIVWVNNGCLCDGSLVPIKHAKQISKRGLPQLRAELQVSNVAVYRNLLQVTGSCVAT